MQILDERDKVELQNQIDEKVEKIEGKGLSTNDFTDEYKNKIASMNSNINTMSSLLTGLNSKLQQGTCSLVFAKKGTSDTITLSATYIRVGSLCYVHLSNSLINTWSSATGNLYLKSGLPYTPKGIHSHIGFIGVGATPGGATKQITCLGLDAYPDVFAGYSPTNNIMINMNLLYVIA